MKFEKYYKILSTNVIVEAAMVDIDHYPYVYKSNRMTAAYNEWIVKEVNGSTYIMSNDAFVAVFNKLDKQLLFD